MRISFFRTYLPAHLSGAFPPPPKGLALLGGLGESEGLRPFPRVVEGAPLSYLPPSPRRKAVEELCTCSGEDLKGLSLSLSPPPPLLSLAGRRFSVQRCARCHLGISASEMVMRARDSVYHLNCFTCSTCSKMLTTGDHFGMKDGLVYCRLHFEALLRDEYQLHFNHAEGVAGKGSALGAAASLGLPYYNGVGTVQKGRPRKRKSPGPGAELAAYNAGKGREKKNPRALRPSRFCKRIAA